MKKIGEVFSIAVIVIFSLAASAPLATPGLYQIHDDQQIARLFLFDQTLKAGQFPVRWVSSLGFGYGYPLFVFYPPLVYMVGEIYHLIGFGFVNSVKLVFFTSIIASGFAMYFAAKRFWGKTSGLVASLFYMFVPYRALDVYVRGALAESFSFVWLPLVIWSLWELAKTNKTKYACLSGIFLGFLMITHNLIFLPFSIILAPYGLFLLYISNNKKKFFQQGLLAVLLGLGISAFFWLPELAEKNLTIVDQLLLVSLASYTIHFVYPQQLWNWPWGFGGSAPGLADGISFK